MFQPRIWSYALWRGSLSSGGTLYVCGRKHMCTFSAAGRTDFRLCRMNTRELVNQENIVISNF